MNKFLSLVLIFVFSSMMRSALAETPSAKKNGNDKPNVLFISIDDLNDWAGVFGGHDGNLRK